MKAKEYLQQVKKIDRQIQLDIEEAADLRSSLYGRSVNYSADEGTPTSRSNAIENAIINVLIYEEQIDNEIGRLIQLKFDVSNAIRRIDDFNQQEVLRRKYLLYQTLDEIAGIMGYDRRHITRIHGFALNSIRVILKDVLECPIKSVV